ncbi:hypothetical protein HDV01_007279 [Terramyces sp. JEL0728]|nr:hypothetical protein HDV01_007279 [Terramyces sp. JEL0728]
MDGTPKRLYPNKRAKVNVNTPFKSPLIRKIKDDISPCDSVVPTLECPQHDSTPVKLKPNLKKKTVSLESTPPKATTSFSDSLAQPEHAETPLKPSYNSNAEQKTPVKPMLDRKSDYKTPIKLSVTLTPITNSKKPNVSEGQRELEFKISQVKSALTFLTTDKELIGLTEKWRNVCKSILTEYKPINQFCSFHSIDLAKFPDYDEESDDFI